jgi:hypothetical protein
VAVLVVDVALIGVAVVIAATSLNIINKSPAADFTHSNKTVNSKPLPNIRNGMNIK